MTFSQLKKVAHGVSFGFFSIEIQRDSGTDFDFFAEAHSLRLRARRKNSKDDRKILYFNEKNPKLRFKECGATMSPR